MTRLTFAGNARPALDDNQRYVTQLEEILARQIYSCKTNRREQVDSPES